MTVGYSSFRNPVLKTFNFVQNIKWQLTSIQFVVLVALANIALYHLPLFSFITDNLNIFSINGIETLFRVSIVIFFATVLFLFLLFLITHYLVKPFCIILAIANSIALYFVSTYQVVLDRTMMGNILNTNFSESAELFHIKLVAYIILFGLIPSFLLLRTKINRSGRWRIALHLLAITFIFCYLIYLTSSTSLWVDKHASKVGGMVMPWSYVINTARYESAKLKSTEEQTLLPPATFTNNDKTVVFLVIGEAARRQNFSLYGYSRPTNPLLTELGAVALTDPIACSTYTTASLRCILSHTDTGSPFSTQYEPLPSYLQRQGVDVIWRTKNWGEPRIEVQSYQRSSDLKEYCEGQGCAYDEVLLSGLKERIQSSTRNKVFVILHQSGSHGPSYYKKYPEQFEKFTPTCQSVELNLCTQEELLNAYDNTILYTDYFLSRSIHLLKEFNNTSTMLMYVADHGESLGEYGLYLHGAPLSIAPDVQINIPFIIWESSKFIGNKGVAFHNNGKLENYSQDFVFHSIMGAFDMTSDIYDKNLDIFSQQVSQ